MRVTIVVPDNLILIDGRPATADLSTLAAQGIHAVQWYDNHGEVEFIGHEKPNERIESLEPFQIYVDLVYPPISASLDSVEIGSTAATILGA